MGFLSVILTCTALLVVTTGISNGAQIVPGQNAIVNGDAESGPGSNTGDIVAVPGWTATGQLTAVQYGASSGYPTASDPGPANRGLNFFSGGPNSSLSTGTQVIDVSNISSNINLGLVTYTLSGYLGGYSSQADNAVLTASFQNGGTILGNSAIGPVTPADRQQQTGLLLRSATGTLPTGTTSINFTLALTRLEGSANDGYADNLSFLVSSGQAPPPIVPEPSSLMSVLAGGASLLLWRSRDWLRAR